MAYANTWNSTDQNRAARHTRPDKSAFTANSIRPTAATPAASRCRRGWRKPTDDGSWKANAYLVKYTMDLFNNYTWDLTDPVNGDQFHQHDDRVYGGAGASRTFEGTCRSADRNGVRRANPLRRHQSRAEQYGPAPVPVAILYRSRQRGQRRRSMPRIRCIGPTGCGPRSVGAAIITTASVNSMLQPANSGNTRRGDRQPEIPMVIGPFDKTELFIGAGMGYHSNDARATTADRSARRSGDAGRCVAVIGALARRRGRHPHQSHAGPRQLGQPVLPAPGFRIVLRRRYRRHHAGPAQPAHRHRDSPTIIVRRLGSISMPILRSRAPGSSASTRRKRRSTNRSPAIRRRRSATRRATMFTTRHGWWRRPASRSAKRPAGSAICAGAISVRGR